MKIRKAYTFADVLLEPKRARASSRQTSLKSRFSRNITLNIPIVSANMDTVTESEMARFMAQSGGIGIIHRFLSIEDQAEEVLKVKRSENSVIDNPYTISIDSSADDAKKVMEKLNVSGLIVLDRKKTISGIITNRDLRLADSLMVHISKVMTAKVITAQRGISMHDAKEILRQNHIEKLPLIDSTGQLCGLITLRDILKQSVDSGAAKDSKGRLLVGAAIGIKDVEISRAKALLNAGADVLVIDTGHADNDKAYEILKILKKKFAGAEVVCGNVAVAGAVHEFARLGADAVKIGIGPGAVCTTRIVTGVGVPQLTAIDDCVKTAKKFKIPLIADGGITASGDIVKALAVGASTVMIGNLLAGTDESPGKVILRKQGSFKHYRGMASIGAAEEKAKIDGEEDLLDREPEGEKGEVPYTGGAENILKKLLQGLRQGMYMQGAKTLDDLHKNPRFLEISGSGLQESYPHDIKM